MAWQEIVGERSKHGKLFRDGKKKAFFSSVAPLHYPSLLDSEIYDSEVNLNPVPVNNAQLDGWIVTQNNWHYALGQPTDKAGDGWVGFGGRQGSHWLQYRLARIGYLHYSTRTWQDVGGAPNYDRINLFMQEFPTQIQPTGVVNNSVKAVWEDIWTTPDGGKVNIEWSVLGDQLKENIRIDHTAKDYIQSHSPPSTPANETYFGLVFQLDPSDIPRWVKDNILQDIEGDFDDADGMPIEIRDALNRLLGFMPISRLYVDVQSPDPNSVQILRKRIWKDGDGNYYLLLGIRIDQLLAMTDGDLVFDPTWGSTDIQAGTDDGDDSNGSWNVNGYSGDLDWCSVDEPILPAWSWQLPAIASGATIDYCWFRAYDNSHTNTCYPLISIEDVDPASQTAWGSSHLPTSATPAWQSSEITCPDVGDNRYYFGSGDEEETSITSGMQTIVDDYAPISSGGRLNIYLDVGSGSGWYFGFNDYNYGSNVAQLYIEWTEGVDPDNDALAFGEQSPASGETPVSWATWSDGAAGSPTISGDADWGKLQLGVGEEGRSEVYDLTTSQTRTITVTRDLYGTGSGTVTIYIRGHDTTSFNQDDASPSWEEYTAPVQKTWRYIQVRIVE